MLLPELGTADKCITTYKKQKQKIKNSHFLPPSLPHPTLASQPVSVCSLYATCMYDEIYMSLIYPIGFTRHITVDLFEKENYEIGVLLVDGK